MSPRAVQACRIENLHFHGFRNEGATPIFEDRYHIEEVAVFAGHCIWTQLRRYNHIKARNLHTDRHENNRSVVSSLAEALEN